MTFGTPLCQTHAGGVGCHWDRMGIHKQTKKSTCLLSLDQNDILAHPSIKRTQALLDVTVTEWDT